MLKEARTKYYGQAISLSKVPKRYFDKSIENFEGNKELVDECVASIIKGESVFVSGKCGVGKTHLAVGLLKKWTREQVVEKIQDPNDYLMSNSINPVFLSSVDLFFELKSTFNNDNQSEKDVLDKYVYAGLLVIDDVGAEKVSDWSRQMFYLIIDRRYRSLKPTIITSNLSLQQISEIIDERISSRICEMGIATELTGKDRRVK